MSTELSSVPTQYNWPVNYVAGNQTFGTWKHSKPVYIIAT